MRCDNHVRDVMVGAESISHAPCPHMRRPTSILLLLGTLLAPQLKMDPVAAGDLASIEDMMRTAFFVGEPCCRCGSTEARSSASGHGSM